MGEPILECIILYQGLGMPVVQFKALSRSNLFRASTRSSAAQPDLNVMPGNFLQRLQVTNIRSFAKIQEESGLQRIYIAQTKLKQVGCNKRFWTLKIAILLKNDTTAWSKRWHQEHLHPHTYSQYKSNFLAQFENIFTRSQSARSFRSCPKQVHWSITPVLTRVSSCAHSHHDF